MKVYHWNQYGTAANPDIYKFGFNGGYIKISLAKDEHGWYHGCDCSILKTLIMWSPYNYTDPFKTEDEAAIDCIRKIKLRNKITKSERVALNILQNNITRYGITGA